MALTTEQSAELWRGGSPATAVPFFRQENCSGLCVSVWMPAMISTPMKISKHRDREPQIFFVSGEGDYETKQFGSFGTKNWAAINAFGSLRSMPSSLSFSGHERLSDITTWSSSDITTWSELSKSSSSKILISANVKAYRLS
ncbi:hypothetical protein MRB53_009039 [Persea americana]|uniref:Uncharacterized protein n=1 Tax=Persea americana TaxID=3435 RepID=A0ACC2LNW7_PERAE|nr:hypothetical protein MRB53_009039 [Persea americana]